MTEPKPTYDVTPAPRYPPGALTIETLADVFTGWAKVRREAILRELAELERNHLGYGRKGKPTTKRLREMWRQWCGRCPHCGKGLE